MPSSLPLVSASTPSDWPAPAGHFFNVLQLAATGGTLHDVPLAEWDRRDSTDEVCYIDGAYYLHVVPALARARWAGVFVKNGRVVATASAPVWHLSEQTSGAAEWTALCGVVHIFLTPTVIYPDYAALVRAWERPPPTPAYSAAARHGGLSRFFHSHPQRHYAYAVCKVKAHVDARTVTADPVLRTHALGNAAADAAAKAAALRQPTWDFIQKRSLEHDIRCVLGTVRVARTSFPLRTPPRAFTDARTRQCAVVSRAPTHPIIAP